jgi:5-methylcytosine-specific restriction protein A
MAIRNPDWTEDELILACDLVAQNHWRAMPDTDQRVQALSELLRGLPLHPPEKRLPTFRNPNGVGRKTADIATVHPGYTGRPTNGNVLDRKVLDLFLAYPQDMHIRAAELRSAAERGEFANLTVPVEDEVLEYDEGALVLRRHVSRERDPRLRKDKIETLIRRGMPVACEACGFDFETTYGQRGHGFIECHHKVPLHVGGVRVSKLADLALLCSNCHRMIHRSPWLTPEELRQIISDRGWAARS